MSRDKKKILVIAQEPQLIASLKEGLLSAGYEVRFVDDVEAAVEASSAFPPNVILADLDLPKTEGAKIFRQLKDNPRTKTAPLIFMGEQPNLDDRVKLMELAIDDYIGKPVQIEEVVARLQSILDEIKRLEEAERGLATGFSGRLQEMNLVDLIQTLELGKRTGLLNLKKNRKEGKVFLQEGKVINAIVNGVDGEKAIYKMFTWLEGSFRVEFKEFEQTRKIQSDNKKLLFEGMKRIGEWEQLKDQLPPFTSILEVAYRPQKGEISEDEEEFLDLFDGERNLLEVVEESGKDDLEALRLIAGYLQKGYLKESVISAAEGAKSLTGAVSPPKRAKPSRQKLLSMIMSLFRKVTVQEPQEKSWSGEERRKLPDRRVAPRRQAGRRRTDVIKTRNMIPLSKSELLLIREKLR